MQTPTTSGMLTMAIPVGWGPLTPPLQSTYMAAEILGNVYETLVAYDLQGNLRPQLAKSWEVSGDQSEYTFKIDTGRRFSNGEYLDASKFKESFERSLKVQPASANPSALDALYNLDGFEEFENTGEISGIKVPSGDTLILKYKGPFRQALSFLAGIRYAAYIVTSAGIYLGTGPYQFESASAAEVLLVSNPYAFEIAPFNRARIIGLDMNEWHDAMLEGRADVYWTVNVDPLPESVREELYDYTVTGGAIAAHSIIEVNGSEGRIFSDPQLRRALQYVIVRKIMPKLHGHFDLTRASLDPQFLLKLLPGRLNEDEANFIIDEGIEWVPELVEKSKGNAIKYMARRPLDYAIVDMLRKEGVRVAVNDEPISTQQTFDLHYKTHDYDLLTFGVGFGGNDPDALYHYLGEKGAIAAPPTGRKSVWEALESGRSVTEIDRLHGVYKNLSRAILREVPAIHLAYNRAGIFYRKSRVSFTNRSVNSTRFNLSNFKPSI